MSNEEFILIISIETNLVEYYDYDVLDRVHPSV